MSSFSKRGLTTLLVTSLGLLVQAKFRPVRQVSLQTISSTPSSFVDSKHASYLSPLSPFSLHGQAAAAAGLVEDKFQVNKNSIIRTHDSRILGAKYLNETDLASNEDCMHWCWNTTSCNLAVYEEKTRGSCYLFDCGSLDDFKCRFTGHSFYTSSVLQVNRNSYFLNEWKSQAKQENELTGLKDTQQPKSLPDAVPFKDGINSAGKVSTTAAAKISKCRHYQFECRNNSECIAIYNVCDGIPQCADGSDEAIELECHKSRLNSNPKPQSAEVEVATKSVDLSNKPSSAPKTAPSASQVGTFNGNTNSIYNLKTDLISSGDQSKMVNYPSNFVNNNYNYPHSPNEKQMLEDNLLYPNRAQLGPDYSASNGYGLSGWNQYSPSDVYKSDKLSYMNEPDQYNSPLKDSLYWPSFNYQANSDIRTADQPVPRSSHQQADLSYNNMPLSISDTRSRPLEFQPQTRQQQVSQGQPSLYSRYFGASNLGAFPSKAETPLNLTASKDSQTGTVDKKTHQQTLASNTSSKLDYSNISTNRKQVAVMAPNIVAISYLRDTSPQSGRETNSAVIALTLGLFVTSILVVIVGCRMKSFKKRIARRGRSLAHDADYLVNGLYL